MSGNGLYVDKTTGTASYRGRPVCLLTASEHYGAVINRNFDYHAYLDQMATEGLRLTRLFVLFRELQTSLNPYSPCKPESTDYVAPYVRTGPGLALDRLPKYDLEQWNPEFFARLHGFLGMAMDKGVVVELTLLSNVYSEVVWALSPLHGDNNVNSIGTTPWYDYMSTRHPALFNEQQRFVRKILEEAAPYDNLIIEICNEPIGNFSQDGARVRRADRGRCLATAAGRNCAFIGAGSRRCRVSGLELQTVGSSGPGRRGSKSRHFQCAPAGCDDGR